MAPKRAPRNSIEGQARRKSIVSIVRPMLIIFIIMPVFFLMFYPMLKMSPKDLPVGIINLDKGAEFDAGKVNAGDMLLDKIQELTEDEDSDDPAVVNWIVYEDKEEAIQDVKDGKIYGVLEIPKDFSEKQTSQLEAFETLSTALGTMGNGASKMSDGIDKMGSGLSALPKAFKTLAKVNSQLGDGATNVASMIGTSDNSDTLAGKASGIGSDASAVSSNETEIQNLLSEASEELAKPDEERDMEKVAEYIDQAVALSQSNSDKASSITQNSIVVSKGLEGVSQGISGIGTAEKTIADNLNTQASQFSKITTATSTLSTALGKMNTALTKMSDTMGENVETAVDTINNGGESDDDDSSTESAKMYFHLNESKNVMVASSLNTMMTTMSAESGVKIEVKEYNKVSDDLSQMYVMMLFVMLTYMPTLMGGMLTARGIKLEGNRKRRLIAFLKQLVVVALVAIVIAYFEPWLITKAAGIELPTEQLRIALAISSFALTIFVVGCIDLFGMAGIAFPALFMVLGSSTGNLPYEYLPEFWQQYIYPWVPIRFLSYSVRDVLYWTGQGWNEYSQQILIVAAIGLLLMLLKVIFVRKKKVEDVGEAILQEA